MGGIDILHHRTLPHRWIAPERRIKDGLEAILKVFNHFAKGNGVKFLNKLKNTELDNIHKFAVKKFDTIMSAISDKLMTLRQISGWAGKLIDELMEAVTHTRKNAKTMFQRFFGEMREKIDGVLSKKTMQTEINSSKTEVTLKQVAEEPPEGGVKDKKERQSRKKVKLKTQPLKKMFKGEEIPNNPDNWLGGHGHVKYLTDAELTQYKITVKNGKLYDANGNLVDTSKANSWDGNNRAIFVIDEKGNMYASTDQKVMEFHHSSLGQGKPVAMAGEIKVTNGKLKYMSNRSGHYQPSKEFVDQSKAHLSEQGLDLKNVKIELE